MPRRIDSETLLNRSDTQGGFKMLEGDLARRMFGDMQLAGFAFDVELIGRLLSDGASMAELPIHWANDDASIFNLVADGVRAFRDSYQVRRVLLDAFASIARDVFGDLLLAGDGPDETFLQSRVAGLGLQSRVHTRGRIAAAARFDLLPGPRVVVMPSRIEGFGIVAAAALAVRTPVLSSDIPCQRKLNAAATGVQVPAYDTKARGSALRELLNHPDRCVTLGKGGPLSVTGLRWNDLALLQEDVYLDTLAAHPSPVLVAA